MKHTIVSLASVVLLGTGNLFAISYLDVDVFNRALDNSRTTPAPNTATGTFNIAAGDGDAGDLAGFNPGSQTVLSGTVAFYFSGLDWFDVFEVELGTQNGTFALLTGSVTLAGNLSGTMINLLNDVNNAGQISYTVTAAGSGYTSFNFDSAKLIAEASSPQVREENPTSVPDGGSTLALLGLALGSLGFLRRRSR